MITTINISLPTTMYADVKKELVKRRYSSVSEIVRDALRKLIYKEEITVNGFTPAFEDMVLEASAGPDKDDGVWETEADIDNYFKDLENRIKLKKLNDKNKKIR